MKGNELKTAVCLNERCKNLACDHSYLWLPVVVTFTPDGEGLMIDGAGKKPFCIECDKKDGFLSSMESELRFMERALEETVKMGLSLTPKERRAQDNYNEPIEPEGK